MVFDIGAGLYWRLEEGGLLFGWSDPDEQPGEARSIDWAAYERARARLAGFVPVTRDLGLRRIWAATIDYTPDHLPILGPALTPAGERIEGVTVASAGGHGMMWGPGVARVAADLVVRGRTELIDVTDLGLDRFDAEGRSRLAARPDRAAVSGQRRIAEGPADRPGLLMPGVGAVSSSRCRRSRNRPGRAGRPAGRGG